MEENSSEGKSALNFATSPDMDGFTMPPKRPRTTRDPMSHRIIEKRRRDRMNNCLADLSHLIPASYLKQGQGRIEKTNIIEMAIQHIKHLHMLHLNRIKEGDTSAEKFYMGFRECMDEMMRFLVEKQGFSASEPICMQIIKHLQEHSKHLLPRGGKDGSQSDLTRGESNKADVKEPLSTDAQPHLTVIGDDAKAAKQDTVFSQDSVFNHINQDSIAFSCTSQESSSQCSPRSFTDHVEADAVSIADSGTGVSIRSEALSADGSQQGLTEQQQRDQHIFKFKNYIKSRFQSEDSISDVMSQTSSQPASGATPPVPSANSDTCSTNSNSSGRPLVGQSGDGMVSGPRGSRVPGFALHSLGTYYIPVVIHDSSYTAVLQPEQQNSAGVGVLHPISIPVRFSGNFVPAMARGSNSSSGHSSNGSSTCSSTHSNGSIGESPPKKSKAL